MAGLYSKISGINKLEQLAAKASPVHRFHPMTKIILTVVYIVTVISFSWNNISGLVPFILYPIIMMSLSDTPFRLILKRLIITLPFPLLGGISNLILLRDIDFYIGRFAVSQGMISFVSLMIKSFLCVLAVLILIATTTLIDINHQLISLGCPKILCLQFIMTYRYISILISEASYMITAYSLRATNNKGIRMKDMGSFLGQLILRSYDRAESIYGAMKCRGFHGVYNGIKHRSFRISDVAFTIFSVSIMILLRVFNFSLFIGNLVG